MKNKFKLADIDDKQNLGPRQGEIQNVLFYNSISSCLQVTKNQVRKVDYPRCPTTEGQSYDLLATTST